MGYEKEHHGRNEGRFSTLVSVQSVKKEANMATFVLVHGAWHGGWCWQKVIPFLEDSPMKSKVSTDDAGRREKKPEKSKKY
jgi:hypothetical protein